jgi:hypothetical protein
MSASPVSEPVQRVLDLLAADLKEVVFPNLEPRVLEAARHQVVTTAEAVVTAEKALDEARAALAEAQEVLLLKAQRTLAYARIYAEDSADLTERLDRIVLPKGARRSTRPERPTSEPAQVPAARRPGRAKKAETTSLLLDAVGGSPLTSSVGGA